MLGWRHQPRPQMYRPQLSRLAAASHIFSCSTLGIVLFDTLHCITNNIYSYILHRNCTASSSEPTSEYPGLTTPKLSRPHCVHAYERSLYQPDAYPTSDLPGPKWPDFRQYQPLKITSSQTVPYCGTGRVQKSHEVVLSFQQCETLARKRSYSSCQVAAG